MRHEFNLEVNKIILWNPALDVAAAIN